MTNTTRKRRGGNSTFSGNSMLNTVKSNKKIQGLSKLGLFHNNLLKIYSSIKEESKSPTDVEAFYAPLSNQKSSNPTQKANMIRWRIKGLLNNEKNQTKIFKGILEEISKEGKGDIKLDIIKKVYYRSNTKRKIELIELFLLNKYGELQIKDSNLVNVCAEMKKLGSPANTSLPTLEKTIANLDGSLPNLYDVLMCENDNAHRLLLFFPKFICYIFAISQIDNNTVEMEGFKVILKNIFTKFRVILNGFKDKNGEKLNQESEQLKTSLKAGLLSTSSTNTQLRWTFLIGEDQENSEKIYQEGHEELFCNWPMFDQNRSMSINQVLVRRNKEEEDIAKKTDVLPFSEGIAHIVLTKKYINVADLGNLSRASLKDELKIYKVVDTANNKYIGIGYEKRNGFEIMTKIDEKVYTTTSKSKLPNVPLAGLRELYAQLFGEEKPFFKLIEKIFKYGNVIYTFSERNKAMEKDNIKTTISWNEKTKATDFDYVFPCSKLNEPRLLTALTRDSEFQDRYLRPGTKYGQNKIFIYSPHPFYAASSNEILNNFNLDKIKREQEPDESNNSLLTTFLAVVKNPSMKQQEEYDYRYYLLDLVILYNNIPKDNEKKGEVFIDERNIRDFKNELKKIMSTSCKRLEERIMQADNERRGIRTTHRNFRHGDEIEEKDETIKQGKETLNRIIENLMAMYNIKIEDKEQFYKDLSKINLKEIRNNANNAEHEKFFKRYNLYNIYAVDNKVNIENAERMQPAILHLKQISEILENNDSIIQKINKKETINEDEENKVRFVLKNKNILNKPYIVETLLEGVEGIGINSKNSEILKKLMEKHLPGKIINYQKIQGGTRPPVDRYGRVKISEDDINDDDFTKDNIYEINKYLQNYSETHKERKYLEKELQIMIEYRYSSIINKNNSYNSGDNRKNIYFPMANKFIQKYEKITFDADITETSTNINTDDQNLRLLANMLYTLENQGEMDKNKSQLLKRPAIGMLSSFFQKSFLDHITDIENFKLIIQILFFCKYERPENNKQTNQKFMLQDKFSEENIPKIRTWYNDSKSQFHLLDYSEEYIVITKIIEIAINNKLLITNFKEDYKIFYPKSREIYEKYEGLIC